MTGYTGLAFLAIMFLTWLTRAVLSKEHWAQTTNGGVVIAGISGVLGALAQVIQTKGLVLPALEAAAVGALVSLFAGSNPSVPWGQINTQIKAKKLLVLLPFLFACGMLSGCAGVYGQCIKASGISSPSTIQDQVGTALDGAIAGAPAGVVGALEGIATTALPVAGKDIYVAIQCAILDWKAAHPLPGNASPAPQLLAAHLGADLFNAKHLTGSVSQSVAP